MWMMGIANSFTMEASFGGSTLSTKTDTHFTTMDYEQMGKAFCQTLLDFYDEDPRKVYTKTVRFIVLCASFIVYLVVIYVQNLWDNKVRFGEERGYVSFLILGTFTGKNY